ncbi:MAG: NAD(P)/FAD-dependent oxidoreductase [Dehalococcoidia bacterium]|nr:NAD(P)/FAD-dependent oxidoreductase [Dehalococcoidia bacterium]
MFDVVIIGAGPAGSHTARRLGELGYRVVVVEEHKQIGEPACCTGILGKDCLDEFPIPPELIWLQTGTARFYTPSGSSFTLSKEPAQAYILDRVGLDRALAARAEKAGVEYLLHNKAHEITWKNTGVEVTIKNGGPPSKLEAKAAVLACGPSNLLARGLGWGDIGDWVLGAQAEVELRSAPEVEVYMGQNIAPGFFAWLVPTTPGMALAGLLCRQNPAGRIKTFLDKLCKDGKILSSQVKISYGRVPLQPRQKTYGERVLAVGDVAGQVKPTTAGGIYYGFLGAEIAAQVLHHALQRNDFSAQFLSRYQREWKKRLGKEIRVGYWARRYYETLNDKQIEDVVNHLRNSGFLQSVYQSQEFSFDWHSIAIIKTLGAKALPHLLKTLAGSLLPGNRRRKNGGDEEETEEGLG